MASAYCKCLTYTLECFFFQYPFQDRLKVVCLNWEQNIVIWLLFLNRVERNLMLLILSNYEWPNIKFLSFGYHDWRHPMTDLLITARSQRTPVRENLTTGLQSTNCGSNHVTHVQCKLEETWLGGTWCKLYDVQPTQIWLSYSIFTCWLVVNILFNRLSRVNNFWSYAIFRCVRFIKQFWTWTSFSITIYCISMIMIGKCSRKMWTYSTMLGILSSL